MAQVGYLDASRPLGSNLRVILNPLLQNSMFNRFPVTVDWSSEMLRTFGSFLLWGHIPSGWSHSASEATRGKVAASLTISRPFHRPCRLVPRACTFLPPSSPLTLAAGGKTQA